MNKYEKLIEYVIGNDEAKAEELFHEIVVEKSRDIYESLMDDDNFGGDPADEMVKDISVDEEGMTEDDDDDMMAPEIGDEAGVSHNDFDDSGDLDAHEMDHVSGDEEDVDLEDRIVDVEDQLDDLLAQFNDMMGDEMGGDEMGMEPEMGDMGMDDDMSGDFGGEEEMGMEGRFNEAVSLTKVTKGISNSTESEGTNKKSTNADNSGSKGAAASPVKPTGTEAKGQSNPAVKPGDGTTEPRESKVTEPKKKGEAEGTNKKSLSGS